MENFSKNTKIRVVERDTWFDIYLAPNGERDLSKSLVWLGSVTKSASIISTTNALAYFVREVANGSGNPHLSPERA